MGVGVAVGAGVGVSLPSVAQSASSMRQPVGAPVPLTTNPTVTDSPAARPSVSQRGGFTVTCRPLTPDSPFHREPSVDPLGRSNSSFQSLSTAPLLLVTTYCAE